MPISASRVMVTSKDEGHHVSFWAGTDMVDREQKDMTLVAV